MVGYRGKRALDLTLTLPVLLVSLPIQLAIALIVRLKLGRPVLFRQSRPGLLGEPFELVKFRTMHTPGADSATTDDASRMTPLGARLRSASLDELPTLWNVIRGEMSLVGPRPLLMEYLARYSPEQARRHAARPGLTGLAQISGRNALTWEEKFRYDLEYVDSQSLRLDLEILARTVGAVVRREGITAQGAATMPEFLGTSAESRSQR